MAASPVRALALLVVLANVAGCFGGGDSDDPNDGDASQKIDPLNGPFPIYTDSYGKVVTAERFPGKAPSYAQRYVGERSTGEPTIALGNGIAMYPSIDFDAFGGDPRTFLYTSKDAGVTWADVTPCKANPDVPVVGGGLCVGDVSYHSYDPMVWGDPKTGRLYNADLQPSFGSWVSWTDDGGATWKSNPIGGGYTTSGHDHQTIFGGPPAGSLVTNGYASVVYYCINAGNILCSRSIDGGQNWVDAGEPQAGGTGGCQYGLHGHGVVSPKGVLYLPQMKYCKNPVVYVSHDNAATWKAHVVNKVEGVDAVNNPDSSVAVDANGTVYYLWSSRDHVPRLSVSHDEGVTWGRAMNVSLPGLTLSHFPSLVAGNAGRVAMLYQATNFNASHSPKDDEYASDFEDGNAAWNAYIAVSLNADGPNPIFVTSTANDPKDPIARGACIFRCHRTFDFLDIDIEPATGKIWTALVDSCVDTCVTEGTYTDAATRGTVGVQVDGATLKA